MFADELQVKAELYKTNANDLDVGKAAWVSHTPDPREKEADRLEGLIRFLYRNRHMSPFEHGSFTFYVQCPIFVAREFHRHRTMSYNETSGRYSELQPLFYVPATHRPLTQVGKVGAYTFEPGTPEQYAIMRREHEISYTQSWQSYQNMLAAGIAREVARNVLPLGIMTSFFATCNPRNLMQFLDLRLDGQALYEIHRLVAVPMERAFREHMPLTWEAWSKK